MTAYQLAIELQRRHPATVEAIGKPLGGAGTGQRNSLAQYLAQQLSVRIKAQDADNAVEGAFLSSRHVKDLTFSNPEGVLITSSLTESGYSLSMFRPGQT